MFSPLSRLSGKGPLHVIRVAAYLPKKLKKPLVLETNISAAVDKILKDDLSGITYRVVAYFLLGIVRIYSRKVDYLFDYSQEALNKVKSFVVGTAIVPIESLRLPSYAITRPERLELDAFDLEIDEDDTGLDKSCQERLMLIDTEWKSKEVAQQALDKYQPEQSSLDHSTYSADNDLVEENPISTVPMEIDMGVGTSYNKQGTSYDQSNLVTCTGNLQDVRFSQEECMSLETLCRLVEESPGLGKLFTDDDHVSEEHVKRSETERPESERHQILEEDHDCNILDGSIEKLRGNNQMQEEECDLNILEGNTGRYRGDGYTSEEQIDIGLSLQAVIRDNEIPKLSVEEQNTETEQAKLPETSSRGKGKLSAITEDQATPSDKTPQSKFMGHPSGAVGTPEFMLMPTPAVEERARKSRKRKCLIDDIVALPNEQLKRIIRDSSDLVCKRKKAPHTVLAMWKACHISNFPQEVFEPTIPGVSPQLRSLFMAEKLGVSISVKNGEASGMSHIEKSLTSRRSVNTKAAPEMAVGEALSVNTGESVEQRERDQELQNVEASGDIGIPRSQPLNEFMDQTVVAPETPVAQFASLVNFPESPDSFANMKFKELRCVSFDGSVEEPSRTGDEELDISVTDEELNSSERNQNQHPEWSAKTRMAARWLERNYLKQKKQEKGAVVNLLQLLEGKTRKQSAKMFYEVLVLKSRGCVDVKQDNAYRDIFVKKLPGLDKACAD